MKQMVILSDKGGTGKTSLTVAFAHLAIGWEYLIHTSLTQAFPLRGFANLTRLINQET